MENKLQELTAKIYQEGIEKAKAEADDLLQEAERKAEQIREEARVEARKIVEVARKQAHDLQQNANAEMKLAAGQAIRALKQEFTNLIAAEVVDKPLGEAFSDVAFIKQLISTALQNWNAAEMPQPDVNLLLPAAMREEMEKFLSGKAQKLLAEGTLRATFDDRLEDGFRIGPADGHYIISFTQQDFERFFRTYLRPKIAELLFND